MGRSSWRRILLIALATILLDVALSPPSTAAGADTVYTVGNYPVEATAADAVAAKEKAMAEGQQAAFRSLLKRLVPVTQYHRIAALKGSVKAGELIDGVGVQSERNSSTKYLASLDFSFRANAVRDLLRREGIPFVDTQSPPLVIVPVFRASGSDRSEGEKLWFEAWKGLDQKHALTPYRVEAPKPQTRPETVTSAIAGDANAIRVLVGDFGAELVMLVVAEPDPQSQKMNVTLVGQDAVGAFVLKRPYRMAAGELAYTLELAAVVKLGILEGRWKAYKVRSVRGGYAALSAAPQPVQIFVEYSGLGQWQDMRRVISETPGVEDLQIGGVTARGADIALRFPGGGEQLADSLRPQGLALQSRSGQWLLRTAN